jgi:hypothetical protein
MKRINDDPDVTMVGATVFDMISVIKKYVVLTIFPIPKDGQSLHLQRPSLAALKCLRTGC